MKWIDVEDRLPEVGTQIIVANSNHMEICYVIEAEYDKEGEYNWLNVCNHEHHINTSVYWDSNFIRHWAPLPEYPEDKEDKCICKGNWRKIIKDSEPLLDKIYIRDMNNEAYRFIGVMHSSDDYYYCMMNMHGKLEMLSCVGYIENFGYELEDDLP